MKIKIQEEAFTTIPTYIISFDDDFEKLIKVFTDYIDLQCRKVAG